MIKTLISKTNLSCVSGYSQLTKKTIDILKKNYDLIELPVVFNKENSQEFKKLNKKTWGAPEFFITPLPDDPYFSMLNGMSPKNNCFVLTMWESTTITTHSPMRTLTATFHFIFAHAIITKKQQSCIDPCNKNFASVF